MALYRKIIPQIARDILKNLSAQEAIEVDDAKMNEAELDLAGVMVAHQNMEEKISQEASDTIVRLKLPKEKFLQMKQKFAEKYKVKVGDESIEYLIEQLLEALFASKNIEEIFASDIDLRKIIKTCLDKSLKISSEIEQEAKSRLKNIKEGTPEWDIEYPRMVSLLKRQKGLL